MSTILSNLKLFGALFFSMSVILHFDLDCFYTQVERRRLSVPKETPVAVVQWGSLLSVDYEARKRGISRKSSVEEAQEQGVLCVHSQVIDIVSGSKYPEGPLPGMNQSRMKSCLARYRDASEEVMGLVKDMLPNGAVFERASIDEAYVDLTKWSSDDTAWKAFIDQSSDNELLGSQTSSIIDSFLPTQSAEQESSDPPKVGERHPFEANPLWFGSTFSLPNDTQILRGGWLGQKIRQRMHSELGFHLTVGVAPTRESSKLLCGKTKPDKTTCLSPIALPLFMRDIPLCDIPYLGPKLLSLLSENLPGVSHRTLCGSLWGSEGGPDPIQSALPAIPERDWIWLAVRGLQNDQVKETGIRPTSAQASRQFRPPLRSEELQGVLKGLCGELIDRLDDRSVKTLTVGVEMAYQGHTRQMPWPGGNSILGNQKTEPVDVLVISCMSLIKKAGWEQGPYTKISVSAVGLEDKRAKGTSADAVADYFLHTRLHFMGTWKFRFAEFIKSLKINGWPQGLTLSNEISETLAEKWKPVQSVGSTFQPLYIHIDMDCFFCSVAIQMNNFDPELPAALASGLGPTSEISSANYPSRDKGVRAGMFVKSAQALCPEIKIFRVTPELLANCENIWKHVFRILAEVSTITGDELFGNSSRVLQNQNTSVDQLIDQTMNAVEIERSDHQIENTGEGKITLSESILSRVIGRSCDEALLILPRVPSCLTVRESLIEFCHTIQQVVMKQTNCPCSVGLAPSRIFAKLATSDCKPRGVRILMSIDEGRDMIGPKSVTCLPGVGRSVSDKLADLKVETVADLVAAAHKIPAALGIGTARRILAVAKGEDLPEEEDNGKTISVEKNFGLRNLDRTAFASLVSALASQLKDRYSVDGGLVERLGVKILIAGDDWTEPAKIGGCGHCEVFNKTCHVRENVFDKLEDKVMEMVTEGRIVFDRIRGVGISVKVSRSDKSNQTFGNQQRTIKGFFDKRHRTENLIQINNDKQLTESFDDQFTEPKMKETRNVLTDDCDICGSPVPIGSLTDHLVAHMQSIDVN